MRNTFEAQKPPDRGTALKDGEMNQNTLKQKVFAI